MRYFSSVGCLLCVLVSFPAMIVAKDLGKYGRTDEIVEKDLLIEMQSRFSEKERKARFEVKKTQAINRVKQDTEKPVPVLGIKKTQFPRAFFFNPTITVRQDLSDPAGRVFARAGTKVNPLETVPFKGLLFIDGEDKAQIAWAKQMYSQLNPKPKIVLMKGSPKAVSEQLKTPVFFDQAGRITGKLGVKQVPAMVVQEELKLKISEIFLDEEADQNA